MYSIQKNLFTAISVLLSMTAIVSMAIPLQVTTAYDFITITNPLAGNIVNGQDLIIEGTASEPNMTVNLLIDCEPYTTTTDIYGNWSIAAPSLNNGNHTLTATLVNLSAVNILATTSLLFTIENQSIITITNPTAGNIVNGQDLIIEGTASEPNMTVNLLIDCEPYTTTTDIYGNWSIAAPSLNNGNHTLTATLIDSYTLNTLGTASLLFTVTNSITITSDLATTIASLNPLSFSGTSSVPLGLAIIFLNGAPLTTTTTDAYGNWQFSYTPLVSNGVYTFLIQLMASDNVTVLASAIAPINIQNTLTITNPVSSSSGTVIGQPLTVSGTSSLANVIVRLAYDNIPAPAAITDVNGNWSTTYMLNDDGNHFVTASLATPTLSYALVSDQVSFIVENPPSITIATPVAGSTISYEPINISGSASLPLTLVNISLDGTFIATTSTDNNGNWQTSYAPTTTNGTHTILVELVDNYDYYPLASDSISLNIAVPIVFPSGVSQVSVIAGIIPTTGSGSGSGYIYTGSGSITTINFTPPFSSIPSIIATGLRSSGSSTVTVTSITPTATSIAFSSGTQYINFTAALFL